MNTSVCITVFNEEKTISALLDSLLNQTKKPDEIVVVDGGSRDKTVEIIKHFQKKDRRIRLLVQKCSRAEGRNLGIEIAKNEIIAITDAGCVADKHWLERITEPFKVETIDIVAGFYKMVGENPLEKAESIFLGVTPSKFNINFLPSTRSMAFRKSAWERVGGFPGQKANTAEDTDFNYKAVKLGMEYSRVKSAIVEWGMPKTVQEFQSKIYRYAKWDAKSGIWWNPVQRFSSHNIKAISVFLRYGVGFGLALYGINNNTSLLLAILGFIFYLFWSFRKVYMEFREIRVAAWGPVLQITADFAVMTGFIKGII